MADVKLSQPKFCRQCRTAKPLAEFYKTKRWYSSACKECTKAAVRTYRAANLEKVQEYDRQRGLLPHRKEAVKARAHRYADRRGEQAAAANERHPVERRARVTLGNGLRDGRLIRPAACQSCGAKERLDAHHPDYSKPLEVMWLCKRCHGAEHRRLNAERRAATK